jgi:acyl-CoA synthetase (NDP forming)
VNPLDAWGTNDEATRVFTDCIRILHDDPDTAAFAFAVDMTYDHGNEEDYVFLAKQVWPGVTKPFAMLSNMSSTIHSPDAQELRDAGIPVLEGTNTGLLAFRHLFEYRDFRALPPLADATLPDGEVRERWRTRLQTGEAVSESEGLQLLRDYGVPVIESVEASTLEDALAAADKVGYPVAMKTAAPGIQHKSDAGGVKLGLAGEDELREAYGDLTARLGPQVVVMPMAPTGVELALGIVRDPQFGALVLVGAGGIFIELLKDRKLGIPPLDKPRAERMVDGLATRTILDGVRGAPASDVGAVLEAVVAMSVLAADLGEFLDALDANPLIAHPGGCVAVDALVIPRSG